MNFRLQLLAIIFAGWNSPSGSAACGLCMSMRSFTQGRKMHDERRQKYDSAKKTASTVSSNWHGDLTWLHFRWPFLVFFFLTLPSLCCDQCCFIRHVLLLPLSRFGCLWLQSIFIFFGLCVYMHWLTAVESLAARVISRLPFMPNTAGTKMKISVTSRNTSQFCNTKQKKYSLPSTTAQSIVRTFMIMFI